MPKVSIQQLPLFKRRTVLAEPININRDRAVVSENDLKRLRKVRADGRAVGRARVYYTSYPGFDALQAVLAGLRGDCDG
ncbi:hypothetical protein [Salinispora fenicalii]|uniref:hypothetical protein n=1 Tax=Salinispora fenicalii TaxID=1137263 RepID=UPI0009EC57E8|nr:hypothetical protein [Salinispora fenicalii]